MKKWMFLGLAAGLFAGCDEAQKASEELCGPCGDIAEGDVSISGVAQIDGFFDALATLRDASASLRGDFEAHVTAIGDAFGVVRADFNTFADYQAAVVAEVEAEFSASGSIEGSLRVDYVPPKCSANVEVAVEAQARCEVKAGCDVQATPPEISVKCEGQCRGGCSGTCSGEIACEATVAAACEGVCEGSCEMDGSATCEGTCNGTCSGNCTLEDSNGNCKGECDGNCDGTCELKANASCTGTCHGKCVVEASAGCDGEVECRGSCDAECSGSCEGKATPPSLDVDCSASADCQATAEAKASASLECTPPKFELDFDLKAEVEADAAAKAQFLARMNVLKVEMIGILQGFAKLDVMLNGRTDGEVVIPSVIEQMDAAFDGLADLDFEATFAAIPPARLGCIAPAISEAASILASVPTEMAGTISGQAEFAAAFSL